MKFETEDRRQHPRGSDTLTQIEDLTYSVLRKSTATGHAAIEHQCPSGSRD